jgi:hypothetical protein
MMSSRGSSKIYVSAHRPTPGDYVREDGTFDNVSNLEEKENVVESSECPTCWGRGYYLRAEPGQPADVLIPEMWEVYCDCPAGQRRQERERPDAARPLQK